MNGISATETIPPIVIASSLKLETMEEARMKRDEVKAHSLGE